MEGDNEWDPNQLIRPLSQVALKELNAFRGGALAMDMDSTTENVTEASPFADGTTITKNMRFSSEEQRNIVIGVLDMLRAPEWNSVMLGFLLQDDVTEIFVNFISQYVEDEAEGGVQVGLHREYLDMIALERGYKAMEFLLKALHQEPEFKKAKMKCIVRGLFNIFRKGAKGNFFHAQKVLGFFFETGQPVSEIMKIPRDELFIPFLRHIHEPPVLEILVDCIMSGAANTRKDFSELLRECKFLSIVGDYLCCDKNAVDRVERVFAGSDIMRRLLELATEFQSCVVFADKCQLFALVDRILVVLIERDEQGNSKERYDPNCPVKQSLSGVLLNLVRDSRDVYRLRLNGQHGPKLEANFLGTRVASHMNELCQLLLSSFQGKSTREVKLAGFKVPSFGIWRLSLIELIYELFTSCKNREEQEGVLNAVPGPFWKLLVNNFFDYKHNNMYHVLFYRITVWLLKTGHEPSLKNLLSKPKLLARMIEHYRLKDFDGAFKGHILFICIALKLTALQQVGSKSSSRYVKDLLDHHHAWQDFQQEVEEGCLHLMRGSDCQTSINVDVKSKAFFGPSVTPIDETMAVEQMPGQQMPGQIVPTNTGPASTNAEMGLDTPIARYLGFLPFQETLAADATPETAAKDASSGKGGMNSASVDELSVWIESESDEKAQRGGGKGNNSNNNKKKNNKKKKKK
eukprot:Nk52_evm15s238 gene=Nk52_evmTU15s238